MPDQHKPAWQDPQVRASTFLLLLSLSIGTVTYQVLKGWGPIDALYFSVVTLATVGFGDLTPKTDAGKLFTITCIIVGIGSLASFANAFATDAGPRSPPTRSSTSPRLAQRITSSRTCSPPGHWD